MTSRPATMAFVRALYHWYTGEERLAKAMLVVALAHAGCAGAAFTGELSSTSSTVDTTMLEPEAGMPEASPEIDASPNFAVIDAAPEAEAAPISVCTLPSNMSGFYEVHSSAGCAVDRTPVDCVAANVYGCACFRTYATEIAPECTGGWASCAIDPDSGIVLEVTCR